MTARCALKRFVPVLAALAAASALAGCGWMEWPPPHLRPPPQPVRIDQPAGEQQQQSAPGKQAEDSRQPEVLLSGVNRDITVEKGDTVYALSRRHRVGVRAIITTNRLRPPYILRAGQKIRLPKPQIHTVMRGETLYSISRRQGLDVFTLARFNTLKEPYTITAGQKLRLPGQGTSLATAIDAGKGIAPRTKSITARRIAAPPSVPKPPPVSGTGFLWPVKGKVISGYGSKAKGLRNDGINIAAKRGAPVRAAENGVIAYAGNELRGFGNLLLIKHSGGWITAYAHNGELLVARGSKVKKGEVIARVGSTGNVSTPQLHFELRRGKHAIDPRKYLKS